MRLYLVTSEVISFNSLWKAKAIWQRATQTLQVLFVCFYKHVSLCHTCVMCRFVCGRWLFVCACLCVFAWVSLLVWSWFKEQKNTPWSLLPGWYKESNTHKRGEKLEWELSVCVSMCGCVCADKARSAKLRQREVQRIKWGGEAERWGRWRHLTSNGEDFCLFVVLPPQQLTIVEIQGYVQFSWVAGSRGPMCLCVCTRVVHYLKCVCGNITG